MMGMHVKQTAVESQRSAGVGVGRSVLRFPSVVWKFMFAVILHVSIMKGFFQSHFWYSPRDWVSNK